MKTLPIRFSGYTALLGACLASFALAACGGDSKTSDTSATTTPTNGSKPSPASHNESEDAGEGAPVTGSDVPKALPKTFEQCAVCHGDQGEGKADVGLGPRIRHLPEGYFEWVTRNGRSGTSMLPTTTKAFSDADLKLAVAYLNAHSIPATGAGLYDEVCASCHGKPTEGRGRAPAVKGSALIDDRVRNGSGGSDYGAKEYMPAYTQAELSDEALALLKDYLK